MQSCTIIKHLFLFLLWVNLAFTQNFPGRNYSAASELPNNTVRALLVDSYNILWIGTENGVVKKENDVFNYFFEEDGLALNSCWAIAEDENKNLWFGSYGEGVSVYDGEEFKVIAEEQGLVHNEITKLFSSGHNMYVGTSNGVSIIDINTHKVQSLNLQPGKELFRVQDFFKYREQVFVVTYNSGIFRIDNKEGSKTLTRINDHKYIYSVLVDKDSIYSSNKGFITKNRLSDYITTTDSFTSQRFGTSIIWDYVRSNDEKIFAAGWGIYDSSGGIYEVVNNQLISRALDFNIPSKEVTSLAYDSRFEKLYVGTKDAGLFEVHLNSQIKFHKTGGSIIGFARTDDSSALLLNKGMRIRKSKTVNTISLSQLKTWQLDYVRNTRIPLPKYEDSFYELDYTMQAKDINFYDIKVKDNIYWVNTNIGIFAIQDSGKLHRYVPLHSEEISFTPNGELIETNPYGGVRIYRDLDAFKYDHFIQEDSRTPTMIVNSLQLGSKTYFLSVFSGLYVLENNKFQSYFNDEIWKEKKLKHITTLGRNLAISNEFGDIFIVNDDSSFKIIKKIPRAKIQGNSIAFLTEYNGALIIGTEKGLTIYKDKRYIFLDEEQGLKQPLLSAELNQNKLSIGSENGYYIIDLDMVSDSRPLVEQLEVKEIFINNNEMPLRNTGNRKKLELPHDENTIWLKFSTNPHPYPHKLTYQYRLSADENWSQPSYKPEIFLPFLPAKNYDIAVKVSDNSTGLNYTQQLLHLTILPPFWKTWWFILLITGFVVLGVYGMYKFQIRQHKNFEEQKSLIQKRFEETKMEALLAQMNPHFIFNAMNSIQNYIMDSDIDNATIFLNDFAKLIRLNLDHCTKQKILLVEEIEYLRSYIRIENTRLNNTIKVIYEIDPEIDLYEVEIPTMLLQTFIENVFVHAFPPGISSPTLKIGFKQLSEDLLQCSIEDNGIGFSSPANNKLHTSKGVSLVKERLILLGYDKDAIQIISAKNKGTSVIIKLKV